MKIQEGFKELFSEELGDKRKKQKQDGYNYRLQLNVINP